MPDRILMKDGVWLVPPEERPKGWERLGLPDAPPAPPPTPPSAPEPKPTVETPILDAIAAEAEPEPERQSMATWRELDAAIQADMRASGAGDGLVFAARVLVAGMWERNPRKLNSMLTHGRFGYVMRIRAIGERYLKAGIWTSEPMAVDLEPLADPRQMILALTLNAMVGTGEICGVRGADGEMRYRSNGAEGVAGA